MKSRKFSLILVSCFCIVSFTVAPASAERPSDVARTREVSTDYGDCVVRRHTAMAVDSVLNELPNEEISERYWRLNSVSCIAVARTGGVDGLRFRGDSFRYMLAEGLVRLFYSTSGPVDFTALAPLERMPISPLDEAAVANMGRRRQEEVREAHRAAVGWRTMALLAECVVRRQPETVRTMALTDPVSPEETSVMSDLQPAIAECLPAGATVRFNRAVLRGALLLNYFRLANAVQPPILTQSSR